jgi:energy-coupling factor transporter ATP-binding protein EcfA2
MMAFQFDIPTTAGPLSVTVETGASVIFVGANGGGKTRLAVHIENSLGYNGHRISAHRALTLNPEVPKISEALALKGLRTGNSGKDISIVHRETFRWSSKAAVYLLNDFDYVLQALFAEQANTSLETHRKARRGDKDDPASTKFERLTEVWERLLPHRRLHVTGDNIEVSIAGSEARYSASDMSDGERAIFYMIGQTLSAGINSLIIIDEPELHIHRSIMSKLWDELEAARQDCAFVFITHDLEFAASRSAQKFVILDFEPIPCWKIDEVPSDTGFSEELTTLILGSRRPVLFVEGTKSSLDYAIYRCCFPDWTVICRGSCEEVVHAVSTMRKNTELTRITCAGLVDADGYEADEKEKLQQLGVSALPVAEIENLILLPSVRRAIAESEGFAGQELDSVLKSLKDAIYASVTTNEIDAATLRYCRRRIDRVLKKIDLSGAPTVSGISDEYAAQTGALDIGKMAKAVCQRIEEAISADDLPKLLANYDNKGLLALASSHLKKSKLDAFTSWLTRVLRNDRVPNLVAAIQKELPIMEAK